jgi:Kef-type K+ transport system membrane component KefB
MISRGEVGLIVASIGLSTGLVGQEVFAAVVLTVLATTLLTPAALRALNPQRAPEPTPIPQPENGS